MSRRITSSLWLVLVLLPLCLTACGGDSSFGSYLKSSFSNQSNHPEAMIGPKENQPDQEMPQDRPETNGLTLASSDAPSASSPSPSAGEYVLGSGDRLRITVFNEPDLTDEFEIDTAGFLAFPLLGKVKAAGNSTSGLEKMLTSELSKGYLVQPKVSIEVANFRHFFIMGEVANPGSFPYLSGLTVINAVAVAGGYTYRADEDDVMIRRNGRKIKATPDTPVLPGDTLMIEERFF